MDEQLSVWALTGWSATEWARKIAGRGDVTVTIEPTLSALVVDTVAGHIRIDPTKAALTADQSGRVPTTRTLVDRLTHPTLAGLVLDGAARAAHSRWRGRIDDTVDAGVLAAAWALDTARAHRRLIGRSPRSRLFLRSAAAVTLPHEGSARALLERVLPQVDAGVLPRWVGERVRADVDAAFGADVVDEARRIWRQVLALSDNDDDLLLSLADQWCRLLPAQDPDDVDGRGDSGGDGAVVLDPTGEPADGPSGAPDNAGDTEHPADGDGSDEHRDTGTNVEQDSTSTAGSGWADAISDLIAETTAETELELHQAIGAQRTPEQRADDTQRDLAESAARAVFDRKRLNRIRHRSPAADEITQRAAIVRRLKRAQYEAPRRISEQVAYPAGKARTGGLVQRAAQRANGQVVTATPWRRSRRSVTTKPPLHAGIVVDVSGSMDRWLPAAGAVIWSIAAAAAELGGTAAATGFGGDVTPLLAPRAHPGRVPVVPGGSSSTGCAEAMSAVTAGADLTAAFGARVLVVLTDGQLPGSEAKAIDARVKYLHRHGVSVVWALTVDRRQATVIPEQATVVDRVTPDTFAALTADAIATALEQGPRR